MPIIVEQNPTNAEIFISVAGSESRVVPSLEELRRALIADPDEHAVLLGPNVDLEAASALADNLRVTRPALSVILLRRRVDTTVLAEALRSGMREVVEERDLAGLGEALRRAHQVYRAVTGPTRRPDDSAVGRQLTVFSPKGGVGKTTIAVNLAVALAAHGGPRVCLVDLDLGFGDVAITLQLFPARTIADAVALESELDFGVLEPLLTPHRLGVSTLVAPVQPDAKDTIPPALVSRILGVLKENFDLVVVDTSPTFDEHVLQALDETDDLLIVTTLDVPTLKNVKIACETLDLLNFPPERRHLVLNRADERVGLDPAKVAATLAMPIAQTIPTSPDVATATNAGEPITAAHPRHPASQAILGLARALVREDPASAEGPTGPTRTPHREPSDPARRGLLRRARAVRGPTR